MNTSDPVAEYQPLDAFDATWDDLAERGMCDERGGAEYTRCREQWDAHDLFIAVMASIICNANIGPPPLPADPSG